MKSRNVREMLKFPELSSTTAQHVPCVLDPCPSGNWLVINTPSNRTTDSRPHFCCRHNSPISTDSHFDKASRGAREDRTCCGLRRVHELHMVTTYHFKPVSVTCVRCSGTHGRCGRVRIRCLGSACATSLNQSAFEAIQPEDSIVYKENQIHHA